MCIALSYGRVGVRRRIADMRYVALLRAVNVGGRIIKMERLKKLFEEINLDNVETFIASGNVLFDSRASAAGLESKIEKHLERAFDYAVPTMVRSAIEVKASAVYTPFPSLDAVPKEGGLYVGFLKSPLDKERAVRVAALSDASNEFHVYGREVYWLARDRRAVLKGVGSKLDRAVGVPFTVRNVTTVRRLADRLTPPKTT